jgi:copper chaperone CopZ
MSEDPSNNPQTDLETFLFATEGDHPAQHAKKIEQLLEGFNGLSKVEAHPSDQRVVVTYDPHLTNPSAIHQALQDLGYHASRWTE